jgi:hypothetical protein
MIFTPEVLTLSLLNIFFLAFGFIAFIEGWKIYKYWDINASTPLQYSLEKKSYLSTTIIKFIFIIKVPLFLFFIFTLDKISDILTGAMCGAGVVNATIYGDYLLILKIINLYLFAYWLALNKEDLKHKLQPYTKTKFGLFIIIFISLVLEIILEYLMFNSINLNDIVNCCATIYSSASDSYFSYLLSMKHSYQLDIFYANYLFMLFFYTFRYTHLFALSNIVFVIVSLTTLITFFGTYIYELPSHHCPFCLLQGDYYYIGYLLYTLLFLGTFYAISAGFIQSDTETKTKKEKISLLLNTLYLVIVSAYPIIYYIKNGVYL